MLAAATPATDGLALLRALVETDTTLATGSCTAAAAHTAAAMRQAGLPDRAVVQFGAPDRPKERGLLAGISGTDRALKPLLIVAHIDTVPAEPTQWTHPPLRLTEAEGYLYGLGIADNKAVAALLVELVIELQRDRIPLRRGISIALTCGEETPAAFNGAHWLATAGRRLIDPELVIVASGGARLNPAGRPREITIAIGEKLQQNFRFEARGTASHASQPHPDNAIVMLAEAITRLARHRFPERPDAGATDGASPFANRTTCVATIVETGRQANTIASTASANINCRLPRGEDLAGLHADLVRIVGDARIEIAATPPVAAPIEAPPYPTAMLAATREVATELWPGATVASVVLTGATDARHFNAVGISAYGLTILPFEADGSRVHAPNERILKRAIDDGRAMLRRLVERLTR